MFALAVAGLVCAAIPAMLFVLNLRHYRPPPWPEADRTPAISILIPARNEEAGIDAAVKAALASEDVEVEVVVLDDHSRDDTAKIVGELAHRDSRVRLVQAPPLLAGWCGKQHACWVLAQEARNSLLMFVDADVRLSPSGAVRLAAFLRQRDADLVSGVPHQETVTFLERLVIPLIHFVLLGLLPMGWMRRTRHPAFAAGCGQLFLTRRESYFTMGGHAAIRTSLHDGITLPRAYRTHRLATDLCDATDLASCRMYRSNAEVWNGLRKNATEGLARPLLLPTMTCFLSMGQVVPFGLLAFTNWGSVSQWLVLVTILLLYLPRVLGICLFRQTVWAGLLHPLGIVVLLTIQWSALLGSLLGKPTAWKGRLYPPLSESR